MIPNCFIIDNLKLYFLQLHPRWSNRWKRPIYLNAGPAVEFKISCVTSSEQKWDCVMKMLIHITVMAYNTKYHCEIANLHQTFGSWRFR